MKKALMTVTLSGDVDDRIRICLERTFVATLGQLLVDGKMHSRKGLGIDAKYVERGIGEPDPLGEAHQDWSDRTVKVLKGCAIPCYNRNQPT
jgi:hypothetical protein